MGREREGMDMTGEEIWTLMWPGVPFEEASAQDKKMVLDHAQSLRDFREHKRRFGP